MRTGRLIGVMVALACGPTPPAGTAGEGSSSGTTGSASSMTGSSSGATTLATSSTGEVTTSAGTTDEASTTAATTEEASGSTDPGPVQQLCNGKLFNCGDGEDNDGDGAIDLADPECTSPCDDLEDSLQNGLPSGDADCRQDCFWDANTGPGDDKCELRLRCDPLDPGIQMFCTFSPLGCPMPGPGEVGPECVPACGPSTPNGCDCFGCCHVESGNGTIDIYLGSGPDCRLDNLAGCSPCTFHEACDNPCEPENCELCFGQKVLPPGCDAPGCEGGEPCTIDDEGVSSCGPGRYCVTGCCADVPS